MKKVLIILALFSMNALATPVNVNTADAKTIADSLNGIGIKKAEEIVKYRNEHKEGFKTLEDVGKVKGIGDKTLEKNRADILFTDGSAAPATIPATVATPLEAAPPAKAGKGK